MLATRSLRYAWRSLRRSPLFSVAAVLTLGIGLGAVAAIYAVIHGILLSPLPYGRPGQLVAAMHDLPPLSLRDARQTSATYFTYQRFARTISGIAAYSGRAVDVAQPGAGAAPEHLEAALITANLVPLLEVRPLLGRTFTAAEDAPHGPASVVLSAAFWRSHFGADPHVLGRTIDVNGVAREVVGVMPDRFRFPSAATALWLPLALDPADPFPGGFNYDAVARLRPGVSIVQAQRDFAAVLPRMAEWSPMIAPGVSTRMLLQQARPVPVLVPLRDDLVGSTAGTLWIVAAAAGLLLLVACANVANLMLVRADARQREFAVRAALGAGRANVLAQFLAESLVLAALAGALGLLVAWAAVRLLVRAGPAELPRLAEVHVGAGVVLFTVVVTLLVALACSIIPAIRFARTGLAHAVREGGRGGSARRAQTRVRGALVAAQIALALVVLAASGLLLRSFERLRAVRPGFDAAGVETFWLSLPHARYAADSAATRFYAQLAQRVAQLPEVRAVGLSSRLPLESRGENQTPIWVEGDASAAEKIPPLHMFITTDGGFFGAMGIPLLAGRAFYSLDGRQREDEAIVNRVTAERFWHDSTGRAALGKRFRTLPGGPWHTVVGVVASAHDSSLRAPPVPTVYFPEVPAADTMFGQVKWTMALVVRTGGDPAALVRPVERVVREMDPSLPLFDVRPMDEVARASLARLSFTMDLLGAAAAVTLLLGAIGLYGVIAYVVGLRRRELGVRIALGAAPRQVERMVMRQGVMLAAWGIAAGLVLFALVVRFLRSQLFGVTAADPVTLAAVAASLVAVAALASWVPARRAARVDPREALSAE